MHAPRGSALGFGLMAMAAAACSDSTAASRHAVTLSISTRSAAPAAASAWRPDITVTTGSNTLVVSKAQVVLSEIELKSASTATCNTKENGDCSELELDPMLVDLPLGAMTQLDLGALVPAGSYRELSFTVDAVQSDEHSGSAAFLTAHPDFANIAVRVAGTYNGKSFVFTSGQDFGFDMEFKNAVVVGGSTPTNLTIAIDVGTWFKDANGSLLDPSDPANASSIANNIKRSFHAFEDDNHDGVDDHS